MTDNIICVLDIGSWNINVLAVKLTEDGKVRYVYSSSSRSAGIDKGKVTNVDYLSDSIENAISKMEEQLKKRIFKASICISGDHIKSYDSRGMIVLSELGSEITQQDVEKAIDSAKLLSVPMDRRILHIYEQGFTVDGQSDITMPVGMFGTKLEANLHIITALENKVQSIIKAINNIGVNVDRVMFSGLMNVYGVLSEEEIKRGAVILDIGAGSSNIVAIKEGSFLASKIFPFSGKEITTQIKKELNIPFKEAESRKKDVVSFYSKADIDKSIFLDSIDEDVIEIVYKMMRKNLEKIKQDLDDKVLYLASENFIVTGTTALMGGVVELLEDVFNVRAKIANPRIFNTYNGDNLLLNLCQYSASAGMLNTLLKEKNIKYSNKHANKIYITLNKVREFFCEYF